ncbi:MAG: hypothetical protein ACHQ52_04495 [Candidatus Eisenbacteria bacterium]
MSQPEHRIAPRAATPWARRSRNTAATIALACLAVSGGASTAHAWSPWPRVDDTARGRLVDVQIEVDGRDVPLYPSPRWDSRRYFEAMRAHEYSVVLRNTTGGRVAVLVSVDGLNVISGQRSALGNGESMYVLDPYGSATIHGWRTSLDDVRRFVFVDEERSYATRSGQANGDLGWIRVLAFRERQPQVSYEQRSRLDDERAQQPRAAAPGNEPRDGAAAPETQSGAPSPPQKTARQAAGELRADKDESNANPGTGWGRGSYDPVREVEFLAESNPLDRITLRYEYADGLRALGIEPVRDRDRNWQRDRGQLGFAEPPRW